MKISQLRILLSDIEAEHGDIDVCDTNGDWIGAKVQKTPEHFESEFEKVLVLY